MTKFARAVMKLLLQSEAPLGWYQIERRLANVTLDQRPQLPPVLADLVQKGWVQESTANEEPRTRYSLTERGRAALQN